MDIYLLKYLYWYDLFCAVFKVLPLLSGVSSYPMRMRSESDPNPIKNREHRNKEGVYPLTRCVSDPNPIIRPVFFYRIGERIFWKIGRKNGLGLGLGPETGVIPWRITEWRNIDLE